MRQFTRSAKHLPALALFAAVSTAAATGPSRAHSQASPGRLLRPDDYFGLESVGRPAISPDGSQVAFVRTRTLRDEDRRHDEIWIVPSDGSAQPRRLTSPAFSAADPRWSPDGKLLSFSSARTPPRNTAGGEASEPDRGNRSDIWFLDMGGASGEAFQVLGVDGPPIFSPDGRWIAFVRSTPARSASSGGALGRSAEFERELESRFRGRIYDWMRYRFDRRGYLADGRDPAATPPRDLYVLPRAGGTARRLTRLGFDVADVAWRPDSNAMAFAADAEQRDEHTYTRTDLWLVNLESQLLRLTDDLHVNSTPNWSPDGERIAFRRTEGLGILLEARRGRGSPVDVYSMLAPGTPPAPAPTATNAPPGLVNLTPDWDLRPGAPHWMGDGRIYFAAGSGGEQHLFATRPGSAVEAVTSGARRLTDFTLATDSSARGRLSFVGSTSAQLGELYAAAIDGSAEIALTSINSFAIDNIRVAPTHRIDFASADGTMIEGWVLLPPDYGSGAGAAGRTTSEAPRLHPLVVAIHGGPHSAYGESFSFQQQLWAAQGYLVLATNPRGSTGYGEDFLWATWGGWGNLDFDDVMAGVDHVVANYNVDPQRIGVTGYSYGGFLTNWAITHTDRFAATISGAGISNWLSDYGTADIPQAKETEFFGAPWKEPSAELLWEQSPIKHADGVSTPTLFIHGEEDFRVPIEQGEQMYTALRKQIVAARFVRYPDTSHGGWTPWNTVHRYWQELQWWREHLESTTPRRTRPTSERED